MAVYYFKTKDKQAKGYIRKCVVDAFKSEGMTPRRQNFRIFNEHNHPYADLGFTKVTIRMPTKRINTKINFRLHRNGRNYRIFKEDEEGRGLYLIKDVRAILGKQVDEYLLTEPAPGWTQLSFNQVKRPDTGVYPAGYWFLNQDHSLVINAPSKLDKPAAVYENLCAARKVKQAGQ